MATRRYRLDLLAERALLVVSADPQMLGALGVVGEMDSHHAQKQAQVGAAEQGPPLGHRLDPVLGAASFHLANLGG